jgi:hypothetical protein
MTSIGPHDGVDIGRTQGSDRAIRYSQAAKRTKSVILDELCATTGWHRNHARKALTTALQPKLVAPRSPRAPGYGPEVIATGRTENCSVPSKAAPCVFRALKAIAEKMPFPILGVDSDNGSEFINIHLLQWCEKHKITVTRARPATKNDGRHVEQKYWAVVRSVAATTATTRP